LTEAGGKRSPPAPPRRYRRAKSADIAGGLENGPAPGPGRKRVARRSPEVARQEIVDAAARFLQQHPFRELTIPALMAETNIGRSAFYVYFKDIYGVVEVLISRLRDQVLEYFDRWMTADLEPVEALRKFIADTVSIWAANGPMLGAILGAAADDPRLEIIAREIVEIYKRGVAEMMTRDHRAGRIDAMDFEEMAIALVVGGQAYLRARLGHSGRRDPEKVAATLQEVWIRSIYGKVPR
jgi:AcrR family transcriptional regulator